MSVSFRPLALAALFLASATAHAHPVTVADTATSGGTWSGNTFTPNAANAVVSRAEVLARLGSGEVTIQSTGSDAITLATSLAWNANTLTLKSGGDIQFNASQSLTASAGLVLEWGQSGLDVDSDYGYFLADGVKIDLTDNTGFKTRRGSNGALINYTIITRVGTDLDGGYDPNGLQWSGVNAALGADIDADVTGAWNTGRGFVPGFRARFAGLGHSIDGLWMRAMEAHVPDAAQRSTRGGLFTTVDYVQDLRLTNLNVEVEDGNRVGGVAGVLTGRMRNVHVSGQVTVSNTAQNTSIGGLVGHTWGRITDSSSAATVMADRARDVGGLTGTLQAQSGYTATIERSRNTGAVTGSTYVGGLAGRVTAANYLVNTKARIVASHNTGTVTGVNYWNRIGGLAGSAERVDIVDSSSVATVTSQDSRGEYIGGLVGEAWGSVIRGSYSAGTVRGQKYLGGLVGSIIPLHRQYGEYVGSIEHSFSAASVQHGADQAAEFVGGLAGEARGVLISQSFSSGPMHVREGRDVGGLVGRLWPYHTGTGGEVVCHGVPEERGTRVDNSYSLSAIVIESGTRVGGLIGRLGWATDGGARPCKARVVNSYAAGSLNWGWSTATQFGGLIGSNESFGSDIVIKSFWDTGRTTIGVSAGGEPQGNMGSWFFYYQMGDFWDFNGIWHVNQTAARDVLPGLRTIRAQHPLDVRMTADTTYTGSASTWNGVTPTLTYSIGGTVIPDPGIRPALVESDVSIGDANPGWQAGTYEQPVSGVDTEQFNLTYSGGLTVHPAPLTIRMNAVNKTYDGTFFSGNFSHVQILGFVGGENASVLQGTLAFSGSGATARHVGSYPNILPGGLTAANYQITFLPGSLTIHPRPITLRPVADTKVYDGTAHSDKIPTISVGQLVGGDFLIQLSQTFDSAHAGTQPMHIPPFHVGDGNGGRNYQITTDTSVTGTITPAPLTVRANDASKPFNTPAYSGGNGVQYFGFVNGEGPGVLAGTLTYGGTSQGATAIGTGYTIVPSGLSSPQGNYAITFEDGILTIGNSALTVRANDVTRTYDGSAFSGHNGVTYEGFEVGDDESILIGTLVYGGDAQGAVNAGSYAITPSGLSSSKYDIAFVPGTLAIERAPLTVTAENKSRTYDRTPFDDFSASITGFVNGEGMADLQGALTWHLRTCGGCPFITYAPYAGDYIILPGGLTSPNYAITWVEGQLSIARLPLTVTAFDYSRAYTGVTLENLGWAGLKVEGFLPGDSLEQQLELLSQMTGTTYIVDPPVYNAASRINAGTYPMQVRLMRRAVPGGPQDINPTNRPLPGYTPVYVDGVLTITPTPLTITARDDYRANGSAPYTGWANTGGNFVDYDGFVNNQDQSVLTPSNPTYSGNSWHATAEGFYDIIPGGQTANNGNYAITYVAGTLTIGNPTLEYAITTHVSPAEGGTLACTPNPVSRGADSVCTATPDAGYEVSAWGDACAATPASSLSCTLANVQAPQTVSVTFQLLPPATHLITATPGANGGLTCTPNPVNHGEDSVCTAAPDAGYDVSAWGGDCTGTPASSLTCTLVNVQGPQTVSATFTNITHAITVAPSTNGTVVCTPNPVNEGADSTCTATPASGYALASWGDACAATPASSLTCTLTNVQAPQTVSATFTAITHAITVTPSANGTIVCTPNPVNQGGDATCTVTPDAGYEVSAWGDACTGTPASSLTCTLANVQAQQTVSATFTDVTHAISITPSANGSVVCTPNPVNQDGNVTCTATPDIGYVLGSWGGDCAGTSTTSLVCTLIDVRAAASVGAQFIGSPVPARPIPTLDRTMQALLGLLTFALGAMALRVHRD